MSGYAIAKLDELEEVNDGRCPFRPVRHHFGITAFGINVWTGREAGDRIINEHDEGEPDGNEELYLVIEGRAVFELDGERRDAPAGTFAYAAPLYNLACCESLAGRSADAVEHLRRAIELSERFRSYAKEDSDFDPIREEPGFKQLVG